MAAPPHRLIYKSRELFGHGDPWRVALSASLTGPRDIPCHQHRGEFSSHHSVLLGVDLNVMYNTTNKRVNYKGREGLYWAPGEHSMHPGPNGEYAHILWICTVTGRYEIAAIFYGMDPGKLFLS